MNFEYQWDFQTVIDNLDVLWVGALGTFKIFAITVAIGMTLGLFVGLARPPGKRLQNIQLMSGGEKALTAIALLFALFQTKPSPFCILDEVDAALDDTNVERFLRVLRDFVGPTQFCIVTHHKRTMAACESSMPSSMLMSMICAPFSTCWRATLSAAS